MLVVGRGGLNLRGCCDWPDRIPRHVEYLKQGPLPRDGDDRDPGVPLLGGWRRCRSRRSRSARSSGVRREPRSLMMPSSRTRVRVTVSMPAVRVFRRSTVRCLGGTHPQPKSTGWGYCERHDSPAIGSVRPSRWRPGSSTFDTSTIQRAPDRALSAVRQLGALPQRPTCPVLLHDELDESGPLLRRLPDGRRPNELRSRLQRRAPRIHHGCTHSAYVLARCTSTAIANRPCNFNSLGTSGRPSTPRAPLMRGTPGRPRRGGTPCRAVAGRRPAGIRPP